MKKLLVTAIGAAAALGAYAEYTNAQRFEGMERGETSVSALGSNYWSELPNSSNTYTIVEMDAGGQVLNQPDVFAEENEPQNALSVKTTFGKPLSFNVVSGGVATNLDSNLYFDSLVKFTVCEDTPTETYDGAKIVMWLQEQYDGSQNITGTNLMVKAGYLTGDSGVVATNYTCGQTIAGDFADKWHRVTIKAMPTISTATTVPGFAIFIDGGPNTMEVSSDDAKWDVAPALTETAAYYGQTKLFPSLIQDSENPTKSTLTCASFDGTGTLNDMVFTSKAPDFAEDYVAPKATVVNDQDEPIIGSPFTSLEAAVAAVNGLTSGTYTFTLSKGVVLDAPLAFESSANIILDFAGCVLTNESDSAAAISNAGTLTLTNSTVNVGGIYCADDGAAVSQAGTGALVIGGGVFNGDVDFAEALDVTVMGGSFKNDETYFETEERESGTWIADGKTLQENQETGLYDVVDYVPPTTYTVEFISGEGSTTNKETDVAGTVIEVPTPAVVDGKSFSAWSPAIAGETVTIEADATYTALYTNNIYTITFVIGENQTSVPKEYGSEITSVPEIPVRVGYTGAWDDDPAGDTVTGDKTYTYTYSPETYTITFVNERGDDPASTNYTIESGAITLPTATTGNVGVQFDGWTNATITAAITEFTPSAENVGDFTLYAAWSSTGSSGFDGGDGNSFTIDPGTVATVEAAIGGGKKITDTVAGTDMTYAQAYALGLVNESTGAVDELDATIEMKNGKVVVGLSSTPSSSYTITLKVYEKASLTAAWPVEPTQTYTLDSATATTGFTPSGSGAGFYKTEVTISNK